MKMLVYEYEIKEDNNNIIIGSFTIKENAKHPEIVKELKAHKVDEFKY